LDKSVCTENGLAVRKVLNLPEKGSAGGPASAKRSCRPNCLKNFGQFHPDNRQDYAPVFQYARGVIPDVVTYDHMND
jgi:hypothetical protein